MLVGWCRKSITIVLNSNNIGLGFTDIVDGNNILDVYNLISELKASMSVNPRPILLEFKTFRMRGHEEASGTKYVPQELMDLWAEKDPVANFKQYLESIGVLSDDLDAQFKAFIKSEIDVDWAKVQEEPEIIASLSEELNDVYKHYEFEAINPSSEIENIRLIDALSNSLRESMQRHPNLVIMGQDIAEYGGAFKITDGFVDLFG